MFKKQQKAERPRPTRIQKLDDASLRGWMNTSLMELGASFDLWSFHNGDPDEVTKILEIVNDLWAELQERKK